VISERLHSEFRASAQQFQSSCAAILGQLHSGYAASSERLRSEFRASAQRFQSGDCAAVSERPRSGFKAVAQRF
jgi:hypothetical protein